MKNSVPEGFFLDNIDKDIIHILMNEAQEKASLNEISEILGLSSATIHQRIKKMEQAGVLQSHITLINPKKIGYKTIAFVEISIELPFNHIKNTIKFLENIPQITEIHTITGSPTLLIKITCKDNEHLTSILKEIQNLSYVKNTKTHISLEENINRFFKIK